MTGDYRFCPACAFRLRTEGGEEEPQAPRASWRARFLVSAVAAGLLASALGGVVLFHPSWLGPRRPPDPPPTAPAVTPKELAEPAIRVADIPELLVEIPPGYAYEVPLDAIPGLDTPMPDGDETVREYWSRRLAGRARDGVIKLIAYLGYPMRVLRYEVTRGQYEEFLRDIEAHRERIPAVWAESDRAARPEDVILWRHVPEPWVLRDSDGAPVAWEVQPADRNLPVSRVSYVDALGFCEWVSERLGLELGIPFAMEWVRAARGGHLDYAWPWGNRKLIYACNNRASWGRPMFVQYLHAEPQPGGGRTTEGLYAMAGNVAEYALDHDLVLVPQALASEPPLVTWKQKAETPPDVSAFGGSFRSGIYDCTVESRTIHAKWERDRDDVGFRLILRVPPR